MVHFVRLLLALLAVAAGAAFASTCTQYKVLASNGSVPNDTASPWKETKLAACSARVAYLASTAGAGFTYELGAPSETKCNYVQKYNGSVSGTYATDYTSRSGDYCNACGDKGGQVETINLTTGWARSPNPRANDIAINKPIPWGTNVCDGQCLIHAPMDPANLGECFRSQVPGPNGLHRMSCDVKFTHQAAECAAGQPKNPDLDPNAPEPPCPGTMGQVNGKKVCIPNVTEPYTDPTGSAGQGHGNPAAGPRPGSGSGSGDGPGRTPATGEGGNEGGGTNAAVPGGGSEGNGTGDGTPAGGSVGADNDSEPGPDPCGLPGSPPCKIDETGTPDGSATQGMRGDVAAAGDGVNNTVLGMTSPTLSWQFVLPIPEGTCQALTWSDGKGHGMGISPCDDDLVGDLRAMLAWLLAALTAVYCWRSVRQFVSG